LHTAVCRQCMWCRTSPHSTETAVNNALAEPLSSSAMAEVAGEYWPCYPPKLPHKLWRVPHTGTVAFSDSGNTWRPVSDLMGNMTVSSLAVDPGNPDLCMRARRGRSNDVAFRAPACSSLKMARKLGIASANQARTVGETGATSTICNQQRGRPSCATSDNSHNGFIYRSTDGGLNWDFFRCIQAASRPAIWSTSQVRSWKSNTAIFMDAYANVTHSIDGGITWQVAGNRLLANSL